MRVTMTQSAPRWPGKTGGACSAFERTPKDRWGTPTRPHAVTFYGCSLTQRVSRAYAVRALT